jgi:PPK2 family polyphosphate:nucleotide phosphotransferase
LIIDAGHTAFLAGGNGTAQKSLRMPADISNWEAAHGGPVPTFTARRVKPGSRPDLSRIATRTADYDKDRLKQKLATTTKKIAELQARLHAEDRRSLLVVFQAMDAGGKDGTIHRVFGDCDVHGLHVRRFQAPSPTEKAHDFLWRVHAEVPPRGMLGVFNRSHYEAVVTERVLGLAPGADWHHRYARINEFERLLADEGTRVVKFFLHLSRKEQRVRLQERLDDPEKRWKFDPHDLEQRRRWDAFMRAYAKAIAATSTRRAPWYIVPADRNPPRDLMVATRVLRILQEMDPRYPRPKGLPRRVA